MRNTKALVCIISYAEALESLRNYVPQSNADRVEYTLISAATQLFEGLGITREHVDAVIDFSAAESRFVANEDRLIRECWQSIQPFGISNEATSPYLYLTTTSHDAARLAGYLADAEAVAQEFGRICGAYSILPPRGDIPNQFRVAGERMLEYVLQSKEFTVMVFV